MQAKVNNGQSIIDLTIQHTGSIEGLFDVLHLNGLKSLSVLPQSIEVPQPLNTKIVAFFQTESIQLATNVPQSGSFSNSFSNDFN
jgi:hypothetical protein